jgi:7-keto-8-aminopelargonate synthetase-like enzyme
MGTGRSGRLVIYPATPLMPGPTESLRSLAAEGLLRRQRPLDSPSGVRVTREGRTLWNFASNDYLGLARHPEITAALVEGVERYGAGAAASRLVCGTLPPHRVLEDLFLRICHRPRGDPSGGWEIRFRRAR